MFEEYNINRVINFNLNIMQLFRELDSETQANLLIDAIEELPKKQCYKVAKHAVLCLNEETIQKLVSYLRTNGIIEYTTDVFKITE